MPTRTQPDLRAVVGQTLIIGFEGLEISAKLRTTLETIQPAGVILFARNIKDSQQTWGLLRECQRYVSTPMFLCVDMEGGTVDRLRNVIAPAPSVADIVAGGNRKVFRRHGYVIGQECRALGFNTDFAPVFDLGFEASRSVLTSRTGSDDPRKVVIYVREFLRGLKDAHVLGCGKHFPGLGEANLDTHKELPSINKPWKRLWNEDLHPYRILHRQLPFVMVAHAAYPAVTRDRTPASISRKWISDILRKKIGYPGLIVCDDLEMGGVQTALPMGEAAIATMHAGSDISLVCHNEEGVWTVFEAVFKRAEKDRRLRQRLTDACRHVLAVKKKYSELKRHAPAPSEATLEKLQRAIWELAEEARLAAV